MGEGEGVIGTIVAQYSGAPSSAVAYLQVVHCSLLERFLSDHCVDRVTRNPGWGGGRREGGLIRGIISRINVGIGPPLRREKMGRPTNVEKMGRLLM